MWKPSLLFPPPTPAVFNCVAWGLRLWFVGLGVVRGSWWGGVPGVADVFAPPRHADLGGAQSLFPRLVSFALAGCPCLLLCSRPGGASSPLKSKWSARFWQFPGRGCPTREEG